MNKKIFKSYLILTDKSGCWIWSRYKDKAGYGKLYFRNKVYLAHRVSYILYKTEIPKGSCVLHKCDQPSCCNPNHLFIGSQADNVKDMIKKGRSKSGIFNSKKTHCPKGHEYTPDNIYSNGIKRSQRLCATCCKLRAKIYRNYQKEA
jgi:hypothetical protein